MDIGLLRQQRKLILETWSFTAFELLLFSYTDQQLKDKIKFILQIFLAKNNFISISFYIGSRSTVQDPTKRHHSH